MSGGSHKLQKRWVHVPQKNMSVKLPWTRTGKKIKKVKNRASLALNMHRCPSCSLPSLPSKKKKTWTQNAYSNVCIHTSWFSLPSLFQLWEQWRCQSLVPGSRDQEARYQTKSRLIKYVHQLIHIRRFGLENRLDPNLSPPLTEVHTFSSTLFFYISPCRSTGRFLSRRQ